VSHVVRVNANAKGTVFAQMASIPRIAAVVVMNHSKTGNRVTTVNAHQLAQLDHGNHGHRVQLHAAMMAQEHENDHAQVCVITPRPRSVMRKRLSVNQVNVNHARLQHHRHVIATSPCVTRTIDATKSVSHVTVLNRFVINLTDVPTSAQKKRMSQSVNGQTGHHSVSVPHHAAKVQNDERATATADLTLTSPRLTCPNRAVRVPQLMSNHAIMALVSTVHRAIGPRGLHAIAKLSRLSRRVTDPARTSVPNVTTRVQVRVKNAIFLSVPFHRQKRVKATGKSGARAMPSAALEHVPASDPVSVARLAAPVARTTTPRRRSARAILH
jgi:hypothetical protein